MKGWTVAALAMGVPWLGVMLWFHWGTPAPDAPPADHGSSPDEQPADLHVDRRVPAPAPAKAPAQEAGPGSLLSAPIRLAENLTQWIQDAEPIEIEGFSGPHASGFADLARGRHEQAHAYFDRVLAHDGNDLHALLGAAMALARQANWDDAALAYERLLERCPGSATLWSHYADISAHGDDPAMAIEAYERAAALDPDNERTRFNLAAHYQAAGRAREALDHWRWLTDGKAAGPPETGEAASRSDPVPSPEGCPFDVLRTFEDASRSHMTPAMLVDAWHHRGELAMELQLSDEAIRAFTQVTERDERSVSGWCNLGIALAATARYDDAFGALERALQLDENSLPAVNQMVYLHARRFHVLRDAESYAALMRWCERSLGIHPKQDNILSLRRAAGQVALDETPFASERSTDGT